MSTHCSLVSEHCFMYLGSIFVQALELARTTDIILFQWKRGLRAVGRLIRSHGVERKGNFRECR